jgi:predicted nucleic acid-binding protein
VKPTGKQQAPKKDQPNKKKSLVVYWDTCVFLAWLKNEKRAAGEMDGVNAIAGQINKGEVSLITSTLTRAEVFQGRLAKAQRDRFRKFLRRSNVYTLALDNGIADLVAELREFYAGTDFELLTPDAIHLATGIFYRADDFQTFDGADRTKKPRDKSKSRCGLLLLSEAKVADKYSIRISKPDALQLDLFSGLTLAINIGQSEGASGHEKNRTAKDQPVAPVSPGGSNRPVDNPTGAEIGADQEGTAGRRGLQEEGGSDPEEEVAPKS